VHSVTPKKLFLIDGIGALLSIFLLGVVLVRYEFIFGLPPTTLYVLAGIPVFFAIYDLFAYKTEGAKAGKLLRGIAVMNVLYCCLSIGLAACHHEVVTGFGWVYIIIEVMIVFALAMVQFKRLIGDSRDGSLKFNGQSF